MDGTNQDYDAWFSLLVSQISSVDNDDLITTPAMLAMKVLLEGVDEDVEETKWLGWFVMLDKEVEE